jgi:hypothetical protein
VLKPEMDEDAEVGEEKGGESNDHRSGKREKGSAKSKGRTEEVGASTGEDVEGIEDEDEEEEEEGEGEELLLLCFVSSMDLSEGAKSCDKIGLLHTSKSSRSGKEGEQGEEGEDEIEELGGVSELRVLNRASIEGTAERESKFETGEVDDKVVEDKWLGGKKQRSTSSDASASHCGGNRLVVYRPWRL